MDSFWDWILLVMWIFVFTMYLMALFSVIGDLFRDGEMSGWGKAAWLLFLLFFTWIALLLYLVVRGKGMSERAMKQQLRMQEQQMAYAQQLVAQQGGAAGAAPAAPAAHDQIASAKALLDSGAINQAEYEQLKAKALAS